jgi:hypothetical protein
VHAYPTTAWAFGESCQGTDPLTVEGSITGHSTPQPLNDAGRRDTRTFILRNRRARELMGMTLGSVMGARNLAVRFAQGIWSCAATGHIPQGLYALATGQGYGRSFRQLLMSKNDANH